MGGTGGADPAGQAARGFQLGAMIGKTVKKQIDTKRMKRELDKLVSGLGNERPTQNQFIALTKYLGPDGAKSLLDFHDQTRKWKDNDRKAAIENMGVAMDFGGNVVDRMRALPEEQRMGAFSQMLEPLVQNPTMKEMIMPLASAFQDGDFSDDKLDSLAAMASGFGRYQEIHANRIKAAALKAEKDADRQGSEDTAALAAKAKVAEFKQKNPSRAEIITEAQNMVRQFGGRPADWVVYLRDSDRMIGESLSLEGEGEFVNKATGKPLNLGKFSEVARDPNDPLMQGNPVAGSPATIKRRQIMRGGWSNVKRVT